MGKAVFYPTGPLEVVANLHQFLADEGWSIDHYGDYTYSTYSGAQADAGLRLHASMDGLHLEVYGYAGACRPFGFSHVTSIADGVALSLCTGFDAGGAWELQPGSCRSHYGTGTGALISHAAEGGVLRLYSWAGRPHVAIVFERGAGAFQWLCWGRLDPFGMYAGGEYFCGSRSSQDYSVGPFVVGSQGSSSSFGSSFVRLDAEEFPDMADTAGWLLPTPNGARRRVRWPLPGSDGGQVRSSSENKDLSLIYYTGLGGRPSSLLGLCPLLPVPAFGETGQETNLWMPLGTVPDIRFVDMTSLTPGAEMPLGDDVWVCWPLLARSDADARGLALRVED